MSGVNKNQKDREALGYAPKGVGDEQGVRAALGEDAEGSTGISAGDAELSYNLDTMRHAFEMSAEYLFNKNLVELMAAYKWLGMDDQWAGMVDAVWSGELFQVATSHGFILPGDEEEGNGILRLTLAYLEKDVKASFDIAGGQTHRMPQYSAGLQYETYTEFETGLGAFANELDLAYSYYINTGTREYLQSVYSTSTYGSSFVGFGGGQMHNLMLRDSIGMDWFRFTAGIGGEYVRYDELDDVERHASDNLSPATDLELKINVFPWLQAGGGWKWSNTQTVYKGGLFADAGPAVVSFEAQKVDNRYAKDDERFGLQLSLPIWDLCALFRGDVEAAFDTEGDGFNHNDDLKLFNHRKNPTKFSRAMADAKHNDGMADKIIKVVRTDELRVSDVSRTMLRAAGLDIDQNGNLIFPGAITWVSVNVPYSGSRMNVNDMVSVAGQNIMVTTANAVYILPSVSGSFLLTPTAKSGQTLSVVSQTGLSATQVANARTNSKTILAKNTSSALSSALDDVVNPPAAASSSSSSSTTTKDTTPDAFTFNDQTGVARNTPIESNIITVNGINAPASISITDGEYQIDGGGWTSDPGTVKNGQKVRLKLTSAAAGFTTVSTTLNIGGVTDIWEIKTGAI